MAWTCLCTALSLACSLALACQAATAAGPGTGDGENLLVFIGQKISLAERDAPRCDNCVLTDSYYAARYQILDTVFGSYHGNEIAFDVADHYGIPAFAKYDTVLLFVSRQPDGHWVHEKYQFFDLHQADDGRWYGCGDPYQGHPDAPGSVRARPVRFPGPASYPLTDLSDEAIQRAYPAGYFDIRNGRAYCVLGTSAVDLFEAKKQTVLKARGVFK